MAGGTTGGLWDTIREQLRLRGQDAELHLFGAYVTHAAQKLHDPVRLAGMPDFVVSERREREQHVKPHLLRFLVY